MDISSVSSNYSSYNTASVTNDTKKAETSKEKNDYGPAATYEADKSSVKVKDNSAIVAQLKADQEKHMAQMQQLVTQMMNKQGVAIGTSDDMWKFLASGDFTADEATIQKAKEDVSEDGYWGVKQTSERIFSFALALSGGDEENMKSMVKAFQKGFDEATKAWGRELPEISSKTYDAVAEKFDNWFKENGSSSTTADILGK